MSAEAAAAASAPDKKAGAMQRILDFIERAGAKVLVTRARRPSRQRLTQEDR